MLQSARKWMQRALTLEMRSLAAFRIAIGLLVVADAGLRTRDFGLMLGSAGMFPLDALARFFGDRWAWSLTFLIDADWWVATVLMLQVAAGLALATGWHTPCATALAWVAVVSIVRRTLPATNAGDVWLCCLLFWGMFLPLGRTWSLDAVRRPQPESPQMGTVCSVATLALLLQIAAFYWSAGLGKWNDDWHSGEAVSRALSIHDHGTPLGDRLASHPPTARLLAWCVLATELVGPLVLLACPLPAARLAVFMVFIAFHAGIAVFMTVGLFAYVGMATWLAVLPSVVWDRGRQRFVPPLPGGGLSRAATAACGGCLAVAAVAFFHANTGWRSRPLPPGIHAAVHLLCLEQDWGMFAEVPRQRQWVYGRAELVDGSIVDPLRGGRPTEAVLPAGGFCSLPHHRWHKLFWELPKPSHRVFSPSIGAAIAADWNRRHEGQRRMRSLEIRFARLSDSPAPDTLHELLVASWPPRSSDGRGNLDRWLDEHGIDGP